jgi:tRNA/tmRNA/rRNA uracil-C5-methylase (TrmA/RlmC/RlmD family)
VSSLTRQCALLAEQHCPSLLDIHGEYGETYALDVACGPGGTTFELAQSFKFVLGIELNAELCTAAKEMKLQGSLDYHIAINGGAKVCRAAPCS